QKESTAASTSSEKISKTSDSGKFFSPLVRSIAEKEGISAQELDSIEGKGQHGRVTKEDLLNYIENRGSAPSQKTESSSTSTQSSPASAAKKAPAQRVTMMDNGDEIIQMDRMRKLIADHMVHSKHTSPHV